jgi:hypothetical protein
MFLMGLIKPFTSSLLLLFTWCIVLQVGEAMAQPRSRSAGTAPVTKEAKEAAAKVEAPPEPRVAASGNIPVLLDGQVGFLQGWLSAQRATAPDRYLWTCFSLHSKKSPGPGEPGFAADVKPLSVNITGVGLGQVAFAIPNAGGCQGAVNTDNGPGQMCKVFTGTGGGWTNSFGCWQTMLTLPLDNNEKVIGVRIPVGLVKQPGNAVEGQLVVDEALHKPLEIPLRIENPSDPISTGFQWFFGIAIPALLSVAIGYLALKVNTKVSSRSAQVSKFATFKDEQYDVLDSFFTNFYPGSYQASPNNPKALTKALRTEMRKQNILANIPNRERKRLELALRLCDEPEFQKSLTTLFIEWRQVIESQKLEG